MIPLNQSSSLAQSESDKHVSQVFQNMEEFVHDKEWLPVYPGFYACSDGSSIGASIMPVN